MTTRVTRIYPGRYDIRIGPGGPLARHYQLKREPDGLWSLSYPTGPIGTPGSPAYTGGFRTKAQAVAYAERITAM